jgi:hypothetical protein
MGWDKITGKDILLLVAGFALSIVATAIWQWWVIFAQHGQKANAALELLWRERLNHQGYVVRAEAASEIIVRALYWLVTGNVMFTFSQILAPTFIHYGWSTFTASHIGIMPFGSQAYRRYH